MGEGMSKCGAPSVRETQLWCKKAPKEAGKRASCAGMPGAVTQGADRLAGAQGLRLREGRRDGRTEMLKVALSLVCDFGQVTELF